MKILLTGSKGRLGSVINSTLKDKYFIVEGTRQNADILDYEMLDKLFDQEGFSAVIHCAAIADVEYCEANKEKAFATNVVGTQNLARLCNEYNARMIHMSSNYVFSGEKDSPYTEEDEIGGDPNYYGYTKEQAERVLFRECPNSVSLRIAWLYSNKGGDFVSNTIDKLISSPDYIRLINDQYANPTNMHDIAKYLPNILDNRKLKGVFHLVNTGGTSRFEMGQVIQEELGLTGRIDGCSHQFMKKKANRPNNTVLLNARLEQEGLPSMPDWESSLRDFVKSVMHNRRSLGDELWD